MSSTQDSIANKLIETVAESVKNLNHEQRAALLSKISALDGGQSKLVDQRLARVEAAKAYDLPLERRFELKALLRELLGAL
jgi:predicted methyltransferase MtxX (methanogen marker protein 4)